MTPRLLALPLLACLSATPALASGGVLCEADDRGAKFSIGSPVGRSTGGALYQFSGEIEVRGPTVAEDFRKITLAREHLTQSWFDARELKMHVHFEREAEPHGTVDLTVEVRGPREAETWRGRYVLSIGETVNGEFRSRRITGRATCSVEG